MNPIIKEHILSAVQTFAATFLLVVGTTLSSGTVEWTSAFWSALALSAARAALKEVLARFAPVSLGGRK